MDQIMHILATMESAMPTGLVGVMLWAFLAYVPAAMVLRIAEFPLMRRWCERKPYLGRFMLLHAGAAGVSALFAPALCYLVGGQVAVALGIPLGQVTFELWLTWWLISYALPLQLHFTANSILTRREEDGKILPGWMPWLWALVTATAVTLAWIPFWAGMVKL
jgi:hypothetical protein